MPQNVTHFRRGVHGHGLQRHVDARGFFSLSAADSAEAATDLRFEEAGGSSVFFRTKVLLLVESVTVYERNVHNELNMQRTSRIELPCSSKPRGTRADRTHSFVLPAFLQKTVRRRDGFRHSLYALGLFLLLCLVSASAAQVQKTVSTPDVQLQLRHFEAPTMYVMNSPTGQARIGKGFFRPVYRGFGSRKADNSPPGAPHRESWRQAP